MIPMTLAEIADVVGGEVDGDPHDSSSTGPAYVDSRAPVPGGLFVAVVGRAGRRPRLRRRRRTRCGGRARQPADRRADRRGRRPGGGAGLRWPGTCVDRLGRPCWR